MAVVAAVAAGSATASAHTPQAPRQPAMTMRRVTIARMRTAARRRAGMKRCLEELQLIMTSTTSHGRSTLPCVAAVVAAVAAVAAGPSPVSAHTPEAPQHLAAVANMMTMRLRPAMTMRRVTVARMSMRLTAARRGALGMRMPYVPFT